MKVAIIGSRNWPNRQWVYEYVHLMLRPGDWVVSGCGPGPDTYAETAAKEYGIPLLLFPVDKRGLPPYPEGRGEFGRRAFLRNTLIAEACDEVVAFWDGKSRGTKDTMVKAFELGKQVKWRIPTEAGWRYWLPDYTVGTLNADADGGKK